MTDTDNTLPPGTRVDHYVIDRIINRGGFGYVYLATVTGLDKKVAIKEYLPSRLARRDADMSVVPVSEDVQERFNLGRKLFFREASTLASLKHPNIVNVFNFFRENETVYLVMEYQPGENLEHYIKKHGGSLSEEFIRTVFPAFLSGLKHLHEAGLMHLDIKPANIHLRPGGQPLLLDFGAVHQTVLDPRDQRKQVITPGYSPIEQHGYKGYAGAWSDIYATGATMRSCIEGRPPPPAEERRSNDTMVPAVKAFRKKYSQELLRAIDWAMELDPLHRPQNVDEFMEALMQEPAEPGQEESRFSLSKLIKPITRNDDEDS
jgi:serine/threonine protein kinase